MSHSIVGLQFCSYWVELNIKLPRKFGFFFGVVPWDGSFQHIPKSINVNFKLLSQLVLAQMFSGFKSPCEYPSLCKWLTAGNICLNISTMKLILFCLWRNRSAQDSRQSPPLVINISPIPQLILQPSSSGIASCCLLLYITLKSDLSSFIFFFSVSKSVKILISLKMLLNDLPEYCLSTTLMNILDSLPKKTTDCAESALDFSTIISFL